jgi:BioD-like phosphotransacetylase family protein
VDILLAAATSAAGPDQQLAGVILTGDFQPQPPLTRIVENLPFPVLRVQEEIYEVASTVHSLIVKTRGADTEKISVIRNLIATHVDINKILRAIQSPVQAGNPPPAGSRPNGIQ